MPEEREPLYRIRSLHDWARATPHLDWASAPGKVALVLSIDADALDSTQAGDRLGVGLTTTEAHRLALDLLRSLGAPLPPTF